MAFAAWVAAAYGLIPKVPDLNDRGVQAWKVHYGNVKMYSRRGFNNDSALVFLAFYDGGGAGFAFSSQDLFGVWNKVVFFAVPIVFMLSLIIGLGRRNWGRCL